ncbi:MAG: aconitate hydratase AcnA, partial [Actinomycetota bacterium]
IVHQVNLEYLAKVVQTSDVNGATVAYPDTLLGTDSHTTMIGGLGVLGWGVGGIEAEAAMLGEPIGMLPPIVVGVNLTGAMPQGSTATDLVLSITEMLRSHGVVGKFVEFHGVGLASLTVADRATISNMSPEYGATEGVFPIDTQTLAYLRNTGRDDTLVDLVERYAKVQHLYHEPGDGEPLYDESLTFDLSSLEPSLAGPSRPQDRVPLGSVGRTFRSELDRFRGEDGGGGVQLRRKKEAEPVTAAVQLNGSTSEIGDGSVVIAAITSCTNTSNPTVMIGAGLLARNAVARGLTVSPTVKTSLSPGSLVVMDYLREAGLVEPLEALGFYLTGVGCQTCIGNSGPLRDAVADAIEEHNLTAVAVLSGNRNFTGRIHPQVKMSFLASPPLVVAYALAGTVDIDLTTEPIGTDAQGNPVMLSEIWPGGEEIASTVAASMDREAYRTRYGAIFDGDERWNTLPVPEGDLYSWDESSTYIAEPPFVKDVTPQVTPPADIVGARVLVFVGDSVTTDHISPAGAISPTSPTAAWLNDRGVDRAHLHSYGARRGNHEVMVRGTFANIRLQNLLATEDGKIKEGGYTTYLADQGPTGELTTIFYASEAYRQAGIPLVVLAGREYGTGSSRDWAAKGTNLLGVRAVLAASYERIHRANLVQMGVLPLELSDTPQALGFTGAEALDIRGLASLSVGDVVDVIVRTADREWSIQAKARLDTQAEVRYFREGGILPAVVRDIVSSGGRDR